MRRILFALMSTITAVVMLFGYRTSTGQSVGTSTVAVATGGDDTASGGTTTLPAPAAGSDPAADASGNSAGPSPVASPAATTKTVTGEAVSTRWGLVQVRITVSGGTITAVTPVQVPSGNRRDVEINSYAVPVLNSEVLQAQSASIDSVSGATVTSIGYMSSLQSAIDKAGL